MKPQIQRILFCTDLSHNSTYALLHAASLAQALGAKIHVLHVNEPLSEEARVTLEMFVLDKESRQTALTQRHALLERTLAERQARFWTAMEEKEPGVQALVAQTEVVDGHPAEAILRRADETNADLIVLGAHDHGFTHTFLGTVAKRVLRRATIPTMVVPYADDCPKMTKGKK